MKSLSAALLLAFTAIATAQNDEQAARYQALIAELRCLVCQNQTIAESNAPLAADLREQVRAQIESGRSDAEIIEFVTARYGDFVLYRPPFKPSTWLLWLGPFAVLALAGTAAVLFVRRSRGKVDPSPQPSPLARGEGEILPLPRGGEAGEPGISRIASGNPCPANDRGWGPEHRRSAGEGVASRVPISPLALALAVLGTLLFAGIWYALAGSWRTQVLVDLAKTNPAAAEQAAFEDMLARLQQHVKDQPDDAGGWAWLGRSYMKRERYPEAAAALARANELTASRDPDLLVEEGEALAYAQDRSLAGEPLAKFEAALTLAPDHVRALWFAGLAALHTGDQRTALKHWERLLAQELPADVRMSLEHSLAQLRERTGVKPVPGSSPGQALSPDEGLAADAAPARPPLSLTLEITVAPALLPDVRPEDTLFVYAQAAGESKMPLAVRRLEAVHFPLQVSLDDSHSMMPARKLSGAQRWRLVARLSRSGNAQPQPGDLEGELMLEHKQAGELQRLTINRRRPDN